MKYKVRDAKGEVVVGGDTKRRVGRAPAGVVSGGAGGREEA